MLNAVVLRPLPVLQPEQLVQLTHTAVGVDTGFANATSLFGYPQLDYFRAHSQMLSEVFGSTNLGRVNLGVKGTSGIAIAEAYTGNFFAGLGVRPEYGRLFSTSDDQPSASVVVVSDYFWRARLGSDPSAIGSVITINLVPFTVIGIANQDFSGIAVGSKPDLWVPLHGIDRIKPDPGRWTDSSRAWLFLSGRLKPGVSTEKAQAELDVLNTQLDEHESSTNQDAGVRAHGEGHILLRSAASGIYSAAKNRYALPLKLLMWIGTVVLFITCANLANLFLVRTLNRRREIAVRLALGAGRREIVMQFLTESLVVAAAGSGLGLLLAWWGPRVLVSMISTGDSRSVVDVSPDWRVFAFTAVAAIFAALFFGSASTVRASYIDPNLAMKEGTRRSGWSSHKWDRLFVVVQIALSVVVVISAGLFARTLQNAWQADVGYARDNILMVSVDAKLAGYQPVQAGSIYRAVLSGLQTLPEVESASASAVRPVDDQFSLVDQVNEVDGLELREQNTVRVRWNAISPGYFSTIRAPIESGRDFLMQDDRTSQPVVIVNEALANRILPNQNPLGHRVGVATIVGVVKNMNYNGPRDQPGPALYYPLFQHGEEHEYKWGYVSFELRYRNYANLVQEVRREIGNVDRSLPIFRIKTLRMQTEESLLRERLLATISVFFASLALLLACVSLYGVMAFALASRVPELGIRLALGAQRTHIVWLTVREALWLISAGIGIGVLLALWVCRYAQSMLFEIKPADPLTIVACIASLVIVAAAAAFIPARRALGIDPAVVLRYE
jgi:predicted permease